MKFDCWQGKILGIKCLNIPYKSTFAEVLCALNTTYQNITKEDASDLNLKKCASISGSYARMINFTCNDT